MQTTIELGPQGIRWCRVAQGRIVDFGRSSCGDDPIADLRLMSWPEPLGPTRILIRHSDVLIKAMLEAPSPIDKMERIIGFELRSLVGEDQYPTMRFAFRPANNVAGNEVRVTTLVSKQGLLEDLAAAIKPAGGKLTSVSHPLTGLFQGLQRLVPEQLEQPGLLIHCESDQLLLLAISDGDILGAVAHSPGGADFASQTGEAVGMALAGAANAKLRMLKSQLKLLDFTPQRIFLSGQVPHIATVADTLSKRMKAEITTLNPFAGIGTLLGSSTLDAEANLPSPWTAVICHSVSDLPTLDLLSQNRAQRSAYWRQMGALRAAAFAAAAIVLVAVTMRLIHNRTITSLITTLNDEPGLVTAAKRDIAVIDESHQVIIDNRERLAFLAHQRRPGHLTVELLRVIGEIQHPTNMPVYIKGFACSMDGDDYKAELIGYAEPVRGTSSDRILQQFQSTLREQYPAISNIKPEPVSVTDNTQPFHYLLSLTVD